MNLNSLGQDYKYEMETPQLREIDEEENRKVNYDDIINIDGKLLFNPYNPFNVEIKLNDVKTILQKYGLPPIIHNMELYRRAFIHNSYIKRTNVDTDAVGLAPCPSNCIPLSSKSNERLEFLGDGLLEATTKYYLYRRFPKANPGFLTEKKIAIVKNEAIGKIAYEMGWNRWLILSKSAEEKKIRTNLQRLGALFEAFIGAVFLDFNKVAVRDEEGWFGGGVGAVGGGVGAIEPITGVGFQMVQLFLENIFETHINWTELIQTDDNYKNLLQVRIQKQFKTTPHYIDMGNPQQDTGFVMGVYLCLGQEIHTADLSEALLLSDLKTFSAITEIYEQRGSIVVLLGTGLHKLKRKSEFNASLMALRILDDGLV
jgi:dsRNA-specific ribonuclease